MRHYRKQYAIRYALWRAYDMKCFYCGQPLEFMDMHVEHIVPQHLRDNDEQRDSVLRDYEIMESFPDFSIDSLSNLAPSHGASCNLRKSDGLLPKAAILFYLTRVENNLSKVMEELERLRGAAEKGQVLGELSALVESRDISYSEVIDLIEHIRFRQIQAQPLLITLGLNYIETLEMLGIRATSQPEYAIICNQLEAELVELLRSTTDFSFHAPEPSTRDGEILSVRFVFPELRVDEITSLPVDELEQLMPWWQVLEVSNFCQVYGVMYEKALEEFREQRQHKV